MLSVYSPILRSSTKDSPDWYKHFHTVFYLSQLSNHVLLSYLESKINDDKEDMILCDKEKLSELGIIRTDKVSGKTIISKPNKMKSYHIEDTINLIIQNVFIKNQERTSTLLTGMGLALSEQEEKIVEINCVDILKSTTSNNWYEVITGLLNVWEFIFLYGAVESTFKSILKKEGVVREEELLKQVIDAHPSSKEGFGEKSDSLSRIWEFYTEFRNIYTHSHGYITERSKRNLGGKIDNFRRAVAEVNGSVPILDVDGLMSKGKIAKSKFYFISDVELNIFRNIVINIMETMEYFGIR